MSGETTNYLGIILAVAGLFFVVVITSILISCFKCCRKQLTQKAPPPSGNIQQQSGRGYGSTVNKPGNKTGNLPETKQLHESRTNTELASCRGKHQRLGPSRSSDYEEKVARDYSVYNIDSQSVPDLLRDSGPLHPRQFFNRQSFESFPSSSGEMGFSSSNEGQWHTPEEDEPMFFTLTRSRPFSG